VTKLSDRLLDFFAHVDNASLEIKTKTDLIGPLLASECRGKIVLSFSVNAPAISLKEERRAASLLKRIKAAAMAQTRGYLVGFHFDPIIPLPGWEEGYAETIDEIFRHVDPTRLAWISLGVLRFVPQLKEIVSGRYGPVPYFHDAFLKGLDGKSRLDVDRRILVYQRLAEMIRRHAPDARIYLCMESPQVWEAALGLTMKSDDDLSTYLDEAVC
jgi:spore photoproduct lyase